MEQLCTKEELTLCLPLLFSSDPVKCIPCFLPVCVPVAESGSVRASVCEHSHMASMQDGVNFTAPPYGKVLLLGAIAAASAFVVTILIVVLCVGCHR